MPWDVAGEDRAPDVVSCPIYRKTTKRDSLFLSVSVREVSSLRTSDEESEELQV